MTVAGETTRSTPREVEPAVVEQDRHDGQIGTILRETVPVGASAGTVREAELARETVVPRAAASRFGSAVRVLFGFIWLADVYFKWQPSFLHGLPDVMHDGTMGQPSWLMPWFNFVHAIIAIQPVVWAYAIAVVETGIALALIFGIARKAAYVGGALWSLSIWVTAEGLGRTRPGEIATDIGTAIIYTVVFLALLAADRCSGTGSYSLDAVLERRLKWWWRVAETSR